MRPGPWQRVVTLEKSFEPLLLDPQQTAAAATGLLSGQPRPSNYFPPLRWALLSPLLVQRPSALRSSSSSSSMLADRIQSSRSLSSPVAGLDLTGHFVGPRSQRFAPSRNPPSRRGGRERCGHPFNCSTQRARCQLGPCYSRAKSLSRLQAGLPLIIYVDTTSTWHQSPRCRLQIQRPQDILK